MGVFANDTTTCRRLLQSGLVHVDVKHIDEWTALHIASWYDFRDLVDLLLEHQANINNQKADGCTPIYLACQLGRTDLVRYFLERNADINIRRTCGAHLFIFLLRKVK